MISVLWPIVRSQAFRRIELQQLMNLTARALGKPARRIWTLGNAEALWVYAEYTRDHLQEAPSDDLIRRMNNEAFKVGRRLRTLFGLRKQADIEVFTQLLYRHIGIVLEGHIPGELCFRSCFFSQYYTPSICLAASALDEGIMQGLGGSGHLHFSERITEGCACCKARLDLV